jgi:hypothetical protein
MFGPPPVDVIFGRRPPDPALFASDPRFTACWIPLDRAWMAFSMRRARDVSRYFPGWAFDSPELAVDDPALVVISQGTVAPGGFRAPSTSEPEALLAYELCIAVGPAGNATVHHYGWTRFDAVRTTLDGPLIPMP